jgi:hypothetical protein
MALVTTLYIQHGKAKTKATEVSNALGQILGRTIPIGMNMINTLSSYLIINSLIEGQELTLTIGTVLIAKRVRLEVRGPGRLQVDRCR